MIAADPAVRQLRPGPEADGMRLDKWLAGAVSGLSRARIQDLIREGAVARGQEILRVPRASVRAGETYLLTLREPEPSPLSPAAMDLDILHEDEDLLVVNKPAGLVVHPAPGAPRPTLVEGLLHHCGGRFGSVGAQARPGLVHRLDKDTSGVMVVAKSVSAHATLAELFARHDIERVYHAVVIGAPVPSRGLIDLPLGRSPRDHRKRAVVASDRGRRAVTLYRSVREFGHSPADGRPAAALLECRLRTGRTHQIRVHLSHFGVPVLGDPLYGGRRGLKGGADCTLADHVRAFPRQALHARTLGFAHPRGGATMRFEAAEPADMAVLIETLDQM